ncbi:hypothetical protein JZU61_06535 [bacterium]|nr:hypothetical protein [bacterium]
MLRSERIELAKQIVAVFADWRLTKTEQLLALGLRPRSIATLRAYAAGGPIGNKIDRIDRVQRLIDIHRLLHKFCFDQKKADQWMTEVNVGLGGKRPIDKSSSLIWIIFIHDKLLKIEEIKNDRERYFNKDTINANAQHLIALSVR